MAYFSLADSTAVIGQEMFRVRKENGSKPEFRIAPCPAFDFVIASCYHGIDLVGKGLMNEFDYFRSTIGILRPNGFEIPAFLEDIIHLSLSKILLGGVVAINQAQADD